jgi:4-hydroxythreonine-4-phosphate dehydrogenase
MGDPAGIGPEVIGKALRARSVTSLCAPIIVGSRTVFARYGYDPEDLPGTFIDVKTPGIAAVRPGKVSAAGGKAAYACILKAVELINGKQADALVTAPLSKEALRRAGVRYEGHTELLAALSSVKEYAMMMVAGELRSVMVTRHIPLSETGKRLSRRAIVEAACLADRELRRWCAIRRPRVAVCALNPHAGEGGLLGSEERTVILPAVRQLRSQGLDAAGPLPGDSAWRKTLDGKYDLVVCMYHDQTMLALKCAAPEKIVNVTAGLPFIRTSPGHGTAFDIAGSGSASALPMIEAIRCAARFSRSRLP